MLGEKGRWPGIPAAPDLRPGAETLPKPTLAGSSRRGARKTRRLARPAYVEPGPHRPTHPVQPRATSRAPTAPPPVTPPPGGRTAAAPPRASSDRPPRCHHVAGSWQGVCVCARAVCFVIRTPVAGRCGRLGRAFQTPQERPPAPPV